MSADKVKFHMTTNGPRHAQTWQRWRAKAKFSLRIRTVCDQGLHFSIKESIKEGITECIDGEQRLGRYFAHAQNDINPQVLRMFEGTFRLT